MSSRILSIGQCNFDSSSIERMFRSQCSADVESVSTADKARELLGSGQFDLVLVNRRLDIDGSSGLAVLKQLHAESPSLPIMLVSDRKDAQEEAVAAGALPGFGKSELNTPETADRIRQALAGAEANGS